MKSRHIDAFLSIYAPNIFYLSGFSGSSGFICVTAKAAHLYTDFRYLQQAAEEAPAFEITRVGSMDDFSAMAVFLSKNGMKNLALEGAHLTLRTYDILQEAILGVELTPQFNFIEEIRAVKEEPEIKKIAAAAQIADDALRQTLPLLKPGMRENEIAVELEYRLRKKGSLKNPFEFIVASGPRSALPHGTASERVIIEGDFITIDFGAVFEGYSSDMTRTFLWGEPTEKQTSVYNMVLKAQELALQKIKAGQSANMIDAVAREYFKDNGYDSCFGHGLGHGVGLEVHELPTLSPKSSGFLEEGMVVTVEPGLYFEGWGGVRIEDLVVVRKNGPQILTTAPKKQLRIKN